MKKYKLKPMKIGQLLNLKRGYDLTKNEMIKGAFPVVGSNGIIGFHNVSTCKSPCVTVGRSGTVGATHLYKQDCWIHNTCLYVDDFKGNDPLYIYYLLKVLNLEKIANSTSTPTLNRNFIHPLKINAYVNVKEQQKIGRILSSIDDKIAINNQINAILERVARAIYEYYFVQFDFPNNQGKPYKSSGGAMHFDPTLNRQIPKDFEIKKLADIIIKNTKKAEKDDKKSLIDLSVMPQDTFCLNLNNAGDAFNTNLFEMQKFDILFGSIRPYLKKAGFTPFDGLVTGTIHSIKPINPNFFNFILLTLTHKSFFDYAVSVSKGTKMPIIGYEELSDFKIPFNESIVEKFNTILNFKEIISNNIIQNQKLKNLRDFLLPLLINAQVQIQ